MRNLCALSQRVYIEDFVYSLIAIFVFVQVVSLFAVITFFNLRIYDIQKVDVLHHLQHYIVHFYTISIE